MARASSVSLEYRARSAALAMDWAVAELASAQHGVISRAQLLDLGMSPAAISRRASAGRLHRCHTGVYAVGHPLLTQHGRWAAAVLACGHGSVLSHRSAAALWDLCPDNRSIVDVTSRAGRGRTRHGIRAHWAQLDRSETDLVRSVPCTSVARTLLDLAADVDRRSIERAVERAEVLRILDWFELRRLVARAGPRRGVANLRTVIGSTESPSLLRSELERRFLHLCERAGLPSPQVNSSIALRQSVLEVDFLWADARLVAETDGHASHGTRFAFERDRQRDQCLSVAGYRVVRFTWSQVVDEPDRVAATLRVLLS